MARAEIKLPSGAIVTIEGSTQEVDEVLRLYSASPSKYRPVTSKRGKSGSPMSSGPTTLIREIKQEGFFDAKQPLKAVVDKLAESGHIYSDAAVAKALQRLTKAKELGRIREQGVWVYVRR